MDVHHPPNAAAAASLGDLFPHEPAMESEDSSSEWLSIYVEDCLSTPASYPVSAEQGPTTMTNQGAAKPKLPPPSSSNVRRKKRSLASVMRDDDDEHCFTLFVEPPLLLLDQKHWLAESELILPKKDEDQELVQQQEREQGEEYKRRTSAGMLFQQKELVRRCSRCLSKQTPRWRDGPSGTLCNACSLRLKAGNELISMKRCNQETDEEQEQGKLQDKRKIKKTAYVNEELPPRKIKKTSYVNEELPPEESVKRCTHCMSYKTPQWRTGPLGPKTLCNACGVRFKSGRLLPEYRPANSPTFVSYMHSNSHKKVMQLRKAGK